MRRPAFTSDWDVMDLRESAVENNAPSLQLSSVEEELDCLKCSGNRKAFEEHIETLSEVNDVMRKMLSINVHHRPSARDLRNSWQKWEV